MHGKANKRKMSPVPAVNSLLLASLSRFLLPDVVVTEFIEMLLVEVNGAGWCLQLVSNRRGPGHLIICLLIARRRTNRSCREEARAENTVQRSHPGKSSSRSSSSSERAAAGGRGPAGKGCSGRCGARLCTLAPPGDRGADAPDSSPPPPCTPPPPLFRAERELLLG